MNLLMVIDPVVPIEQAHSVGSTNAAINLCIELSKKYSHNITLAGNWTNTPIEHPIREYVTPLNIYTGRRVYMKDAFSVLKDHLSNYSYYDSISIHISTPSVAKYLAEFDTHSIPTYFTLHSWTGTTAISYYYKNEYSKIVSDGKIKFVFLCESQMRTLFNNLEVEPTNYIIEPNAIKPDPSVNDTYALLTARILLPDNFINDGYHLAVCRFVKSKHPYEIIESAYRCNQNLVIVGKEWINDIDYANIVIELINKYPNVRWIKELPNSEIQSLMRRAHATVLYTDMEVCNLTILESCMNGTPVVVGPDDTGVHDSIQNLRSGGIEVIEFPKRSPYGKKLEILGDLINKTKYYRYDTSKFPDCYKWDSHIDRVNSIVTNQTKFVGDN